MSKKLYYQKMTKTIKLIPISLLLILCAASCRENAIEIDSLEKELFLREEAEGIYKDGKALFLFNQGRHQKALNSMRHQYRIQTDEQDTCLNVMMEAIPETAGEHITTSIDFRSPGELISNMSHLECSRISDNRIWLWNSGNLTGIILNRSGL